MSIIENIQTYFDDGKFVAGVIVNLKKAFDTVEHGILIKKIEHDGVREIAIDWFNSFHKVRKQFVIIKTKVSELTTSLLGYHKDLLGPLLFVVYINYLHSSVRFSKTYQFEDDTYILRTNKSLEVLAKQMDKDLLSIIKISPTD